MELPRFLNSVVRPGECVLDVGANRGHVSETLSRVMQGLGQVYAFECHPLHFFQLAKLAGQCQNIRPFCKAMSDRPGHSHFYFGTEEWAAEASTLIPDLANRERLGEGFANVLVETDTIDDFCGRFGLKPAFLKIDVEGAESLVFSGGKATVEKVLPRLVFEGGVGVGDVPAAHFRWLHDLGYHLYAIELYLYVGPLKVDHSRDIAPALLRFVPDDLRMLSEDNSLLMNVAAIHSSQIDEYQLEVSEYSLPEFFRVLPTLNLDDETTPALGETSSRSRSTESLNNLVNGLYLKIFGRVADAGGQQFFVGLLQTGKTLEQVLTTMVTTPEFNRLAGSDAGFVRALYTRLLGRSASVGEVSFWVGQAGTSGRAGVAQAILGSAEFRRDVFQGNAEMRGACLPAAAS